MTDLLKPKVCKHCQKNDHNDAECWSTRAVGPESNYFTVDLSREQFKTSPELLNKIAQAVEVVVGGAK